MSTPTLHLDLGKKIEKLADNPPLSVALIDVDGFLAMNQEHGREVGDKVLERVLSALQSQVPEGALVLRVGGDEFAVLLPGSAPEQALLLLEEVRRSISEKPLRSGDARVVIRLSIGIAALPQHTDDPAQLLPAAEEALQRAKREGRDRIAIYVEDKMVLKSNYYPKGQLGRLSRLSEAMGKTEASLLREALSDLIEKYRTEI